MTQPYRDASPILTAETEEEREERHLTEDLNQSFPTQYHALIRILITRAVSAKGHRCARAVLDFATTLSRDTAAETHTAIALAKGSGP